MLTRFNELSHPDQVLVALILKNSGLGEEEAASVVEEYLERARQSGTDLAHLFVNLGHFSRAEMYRLVKARNFALLRKEDKRVARRAVRRGWVTLGAIKDALNFQKQLFKALGDIKRLHDILVEEGRLTRDQVTELWDEYREFLSRRGEQPEQARTDPNLLKRGG